jgi:predicted Zn finger-like uncharacterized protein
MSADHIRFVCESCRAQYSIDEKKVGPKGVKVRCRKCGYFVHVKRTDGKGVSDTKSTGPLAMTNDPDEAMATQVMQTPLGLDYGDPSISSDLTNPGGVSIDSIQSPTMPSMESLTSSTMPEMSMVGTNKPSDSFLGADDDEIGAVFDQVLRSGPNAIPAELSKKKNDYAEDEDDHVSTRVIDGENLRKLALQAGPNGTSSGASPSVEEVPQTDWFVAIGEKQTGPLTLDQVKTHWDAGEISPDSLCWRSGYSDWIPLSDVKSLGAVLAPKPPKPIIIAPPVVSPVVSIPFQSAFSAGGMVQTMQSEIQVPMSAIPSSNMGDVEHTGTWRPSAASAFASLVKEEMAAIAKPAPSMPKMDDLPGLLDLPRAEERAPVQEYAAPSPVEFASSRPEAPRQQQAPANPYMANPGATFSAPAVSQYRPQSNRNLLIGGIVGGAILLLSLIGVVLWMANRQPQQVYVQQPAPPVAPPVQVAVVAQPPAPVAPVKQPAVVPPTEQVAAANTVPPPAVEAAAPVQPTQPAPTEPMKATPDKVASKASPPVKKETRTVVAKAEPPPKAQPKVEAKPEKSGGDSFEDAFGPAKKEVKTAEPVAKKKEVYVPPAPGGGGDVKETLDQSDRMEVVLASKPSLAKCATEQRSKEPGVTGKLVMRWQIQTSGRVSNVNCITDEFKGTYMAACVGGAIKSMSFPKHKKQGEPMELPFKF